MGTSEHQPMARVGRDIGATDYWNERSGSYNAQIDGPYHAHRLRVIDRLIEPAVDHGARIVDFGCGDGVLLERLAPRAGSLVGIDPVQEMVDAARQRLGGTDATADLRRGGVEALRDLDDGSVDVLLALNVLAYLADDEAVQFYGEAARIVRPGGSLVVTHSNELFDLTSLNRYTVEFHAKYLSGRDHAAEIATLLTNADKPSRVTFNVRANPLSYRFVLAEHGFEEEQQEFINLHPLPPLLMDQHAFVDIDARDYADTLDWSPDERWTLLFKCSMFGSRSTRR